MKKEARILLEKAFDSLLLFVEMYNRPHERGRKEGVLILLDHSFEMLMKAAILHRGGAIREKKATNTIGYDACLRKALSDASLSFLSSDQVLALQAINSLRDAAQHSSVRYSGVKIGSGRHWPISHWYDVSDQTNTYRRRE